MREMLFRGKFISKEKGRLYRTNYKSGDWVYGLVSKNNRYSGRVTMTNEYGISGIDVDPKTIGQYTGIKDADGTKIFEGDIVDIHPKYFKIGEIKHFVVKYGVYSDSSCAYCTCCYNNRFRAGFYLDDGKYQLNPLSYRITIDPIKDPNEVLQCKSMLKVIGNIYDNPELLT